MVSRLKDDLFALLGPTERINAENIESRLGEWTTPDLDGVINVSTLLYDLSQNESSPFQVITGARLALKLEKRRGLVRHGRFNVAVDDSARKRYRLLQALIQALRNQEITIALQPQIELSTGRIIGAEALARWKNAAGQFIPPGDFIPLAEATGLILELGNHILDLTLQSIAELGRQGCQPIRVAFNASMLQIMQNGFADTLVRKVKEARIPPEQLEMELTESVAMQGFDTVVDVIKNLKDAGIQVAIDDFGTGFSSLAYLKRLPAHRLKIDRAFVEEIGGREQGLSIAESIISLAHGLGMETVAEGIETEEQRSWLQQYGCDEGQGYLFARPVGLTDLIGMVGKNNAEL